MSESEAKLRARCQRVSELVDVYSPSAGAFTPTPWRKAAQAAALRGRITAELSRLITPAERERLFGFHGLFAEMEATAARLLTEAEREALA